MNFAIIRTKKLKTIGAVVRSGMHNFREMPTANANPDSLHKNINVGAFGSSNLKKALANRLPDKVRSGAVLCIEYLITASPEVFKRHGGELSDLGGGYFKDSLMWLYKRHGKQNVICSTLHLDETTPHLVAYVVPITQDNRLSCRDFLGGPAKMKKMQTDFYEACGRKYNLTRGVEGSKAKHQEISKFYSVLRSEGEVCSLGSHDYAAAALGIKTTRFKGFESFSDNQAKRLVIFDSAKKKINGRLKLIRNIEEGLYKQKEDFKAREREILSSESEIKSRMQLLVQREKIIDSIEGENFILKAENMALGRRIISLESKVMKTPESLKLSLRKDHGIEYG